MNLTKQISKKIIRLLFGLTMGYFLVSCGHRHAEREYAKDESIYGDRSDEALKPENNNTGVDSNKVDTSDINISEEERHNSSIPPEVYKTIKQDSTLKDQEVVDSRRIDKDNQIIYEVMFRKNEKITTINFDIEGKILDDLNN